MRCGIICQWYQYIPRNMYTVFALLCFVVVIHWLIFPCPSGLLHWHCGNLTIAPVPAKQPWWIWINTACEFIMNDCITTTKQSTTKQCAYFLGYTVSVYQGLLHFRTESIIFHNTNITILYMIVCNQLPKMSWPSHASRYSDALIMKNITLYANTVIWLCNWYYTRIVSCSIFRYINSSSRDIFDPSMRP